MNDTANIPSGKVTAHIVADSIRLAKQIARCRDFHCVGNRFSAAVKLGAPQV